MTTTLQIVTAGARGAADDILSELQECRESLPKGANNRPPYPADSFARYAHVEIVNHKGPTWKGLEHIMAITFDNVEAHRMPLSEAKRWIRRAEQIVDGHAAACHLADVTPVRPIPSAFRRETCATRSFDLDQLLVLEKRRDAATLKAAITSCKAQIAASQETLASLEREYAQLVAPASPYSRRADMTLVRA